MCYFAGATDYNAKRPGFQNVRIVFGIEYLFKRAVSITFTFRVCASPAPGATPIFLNTEALIHKENSCFPNKMILILNINVQHFFVNLCFLAV